MERRDYTTEATGTQWTISLWSKNLHEKDSQSIWESCVSMIDNFECNYSRFRKDSFLTSLVGRTGKVEVPKDMICMLQHYRKLYDASGELITPLGGQMISQMGYDASYTFQMKAVEEVPVFDTAVEIIDSKNIFLHEKVHFDFGALGKGYLIDLVMQKLRKQKDINRILINAGGDIAHWSESGEKARIGLENPDNTEEIIGMIELGSEALTSSATNKRRWGKSNEYHHIYNPKLKKNTTDIKASWVIHQKAAIADGIATSLFLISSEDLDSAFSFEYAVLTMNDELHVSGALQDTFFTQ